MPNWKNKQEHGYHKEKVAPQDTGQSMAGVSLHAAFSTAI